MLINFVMLKQFLFPEGAPYKPGCTKIDCSYILILLYHNIYISRALL